MATELLAGLNWENPVGEEERGIRLTIRELIILMALNQDHGVTNPVIPANVSIDLQRKLKEALD